MRNGRTLNIIAVGALLAVIVLSGCSQKTVAGQDSIKVVRGNITQSVNADGELSLPQRRLLSFGVNGKIDTVNVEEGARVTKGQVLAKVETAALERAVSSAQLGVKSAEAARQQAEAGLNSSRADLKTAELGVQTAQADQQQAENGIKTAEASLQQSQLAVKTAETNKEQASDNFRKITYPYTYSTFALDIPAAVDSLNTAQRQLAEAQQGLQPGLTADQYTQAAARMKEALDNLVTARQRLDRGQGQDVFQSGLFTVQDYWTLRDAQLQVDKAQLALDTANNAVTIARLAVDNASTLALKSRMAVQSAQAAVDKAQAGVRNAEGLLSQSQVGVDIANNDLATAKETLDKATITAPFDGTIARVNIKLGDILTPADYTKTIFEIIDPTRMEFTIKVDEIDIPGVKTGQDTAVNIDALPNMKLKGKVTFVSPVPVVVGGVVQYEVKIAFDVPDGSALRAGMSSNATIVTNQRNDVLLVPGRAVTVNKAGQAVVKVIADGQTQERAIQVGAKDSLNSEILSGLNEGDTVLVERPGK